MGVASELVLGVSLVLARADPDAGAGWGSGWDAGRVGVRWASSLRRMVRPGWAATPTLTCLLAMAETVISMGPAANTSPIGVWGPTPPAAIWMD